MIYYNDGMGPDTTGFFKDAADQDHRRVIAAVREQTLKECEAIALARAEAHCNSQSGFLHYDKYRDLWIREDEALAIAAHISALRATEK